jgi:FMN phosphatase YigB (HAD superfamily)
VFPLIESIHELALEHGLHDGSSGPTHWKGWEQYGCSEDDYWKLWEVFRQRKGYEVTPPIPGAVEALAEARERGHRVHLVTARGFFPESAELVRAATRKWCSQPAVLVAHDTLTFAEDKVAAQDELGVRYDAAFDDRPATVEKLRAAGVEAWLVNHGHNADHQTDWRVPSLEAGLRALGYI